MIQMDQIISIIDAQYVQDYKIKLTFNDETNQTIDFYPFLSHSLNPLIRKYLDKSEFGKFNLDNGDLEWNDFDLCFPIADLYENNLFHNKSLQETA